MMRTGIKRLSVVVLALMLELSSLAWADEPSLAEEIDRMMNEGVNRLGSTIMAMGWMHAQVAIWRAQVNANPDQPEDILLLVQTMSFASERPCDTDLHLYRNKQGKLSFSTAHINHSLPVVHGLQYTRIIDDQAQRLADALEQRDRAVWSQGRNSAYVMPYWRFFEKITNARCTNRHASTE